eukprot:Nk52_evm1s437 gene=Nk52_evmTU1s437
MLDKQFTLLSGSTCIVVLLMLLARTDAAPQVGEIDAMQETVTSPGAPSDVNVYSVYEMRYHNGKQDCHYIVRGLGSTGTRGKSCILKVTKDFQECHIELSKNMGSCVRPDKNTVKFQQVAADRLAMVGLRIPVRGIPSHTKGCVDIKHIEDKTVQSKGSVAKIEWPTTPGKTLYVYMTVDWRIVHK